MLPLTQLRENFEDDEDILISILEMFQTEVPQDIKLMHELLDRKDYANAGMQAHKVKSSYRTLGITAMASILQKIETNAKEQTNLDQIPQWLEEFNKNYLPVNDEVQETLDALKTTAQ